MVALISHGHSCRRANNCCHVAHAAPFLADTVWQSHSLSSSLSAHAERNAHGGVRSPCAFRCASSDEQRGDLGLCQTSDASAAIKPVSRHRKKGYAVDVLASLPWCLDAGRPDRGRCITCYRYCNLTVTITTLQGAAPRNPK